jgi:toxin ParE1/3/4
MAQPRVILSPQAVADLDALETYISAESGTPRAQAVLARIYRSIGMLAYWPSAGLITKEVEGEPRRFPVPPWVIFYEMTPERDGIHVLRVLDGRRDLSAVLAMKPKSG